VLARDRSALGHVVVLAVLEDEERGRAVPAVGDSMGTTRRHSTDLAGPQPHLFVWVAQDHAVGAFADGSQTGTFHIETGEISDDGTFSFAENLHKEFAFVGTPSGGVVRSVETFDGDTGSFAIQNKITFFPSDASKVFAVEGRWTLLSHRGTDAYEGLQGQGTIVGTSDENPSPNGFSSPSPGPRISPEAAVRTRPLTGHVNQRL
jgi:hypothetical protein